MILIMTSITSNIMNIEQKKKDVFMRAYFAKFPQSEALTLAFKWHVVVLGLVLCRFFFIAAPAARFGARPVGDHASCAFAKGRGRFLVSG